MKAEIIETPGLVQTVKGPVIVCLELDQVEHSDFYQGHGHAFSGPDLIACLQFAASDSTIGAIMDQLKGNEWYFLDESWGPEDLDNITDELLESLIDEDDLSEYAQDFPIIDEDEDGLYYDGPYLYGWVHVYKGDTE